MKIVHVIDSEGMYGAEAVVLNLMDAQQAMGHRPSLLSLGGIGVAEKGIEIEASKRGLAVCVLRFHNGLNIKGAFRILEQVEDLGAEVIHSHGYKSDILLGIVPRNYRRVPVLSTLHGATSTSICSKMWLYEKAQTLMLTRLDKIVAVSARIQELRLLKLFGVKPVLINNGIPLLDFESDGLRCELAQSSDYFKRERRILSIGRLSPEKGFDVLIESIGVVTSRGMSVSLVVIGNGSAATSLKRIAEKAKVADRIHLIGYKERAYRFIPDFDLFVLPSFSEGSPITLLEAMQAGVPIVATRVGEIPRVLGYGRLGRLVAPGDPVVLADALMEVLGNIGEARIRAAQAKETVIREYNASMTAQRYVALYEELVSKGKPPG
ncbi:MAG TPA: glycosyltransferase [Candidatus Latescibacteria bacterium]|nr:glycosyltransferase [Candidatus Latescibacterota bacterium]